MNNDGFTPNHATEKQRKTYFALMKNLGYSSDEAKAILKKRFGLESFGDMDKERMSFVIDKLITKQKEQNE
jgi:hypothetical protein